MGHPLLCGISSRFQLLSPSTRQVTHALLTRPPLSCFKSIRKLHQSSSVRLACVRHAASVHPEPGSNSHVKMVFVSCQFYLALFTVNSGSFSIFFIDLLVLESRNSFFWKSWNFQGCITVYLSKISDSSLLLFSAATPISYHDRFRLSTTFLKTFFVLKNFRFSRQSISYHTLSVSVNSFFKNFLSLIGSCFVVLALPQQRNWVYHPIFHLSTLFFIFFKKYLQ